MQRDDKGECEGVEHRQHDDCGALMFTMAERTIVVCTKSAGSVDCMLHVAFIP